MDKGDAIIFFAEFDRQVEQIKHIYTTLETKSAQWKDEQPGSEHIESTGYWLHNLYCAYEDLFKIVASFWENSVTSDGTYHKQLLKRMILQINGLRPALISQESFKLLDELRGFRHVFRHAYSYGLDAERVAFLLKRVLQQQSGILTDIDRFRQHVHEMVNE